MYDDEEIVDRLCEAISELMATTLTWKAKRDMILARADSIEIEEFISWFDDTEFDDL